MKHLILGITFVMAMAVAAYSQIVESGVYTCTKPDRKAGDFHWDSILFDGSTHSMSNLWMTCDALVPRAPKVNIDLPDDREFLVLIKSGTMKLSMKDSTWNLTPGSVALLMPGQHYSWANQTSDSCTFFVVAYRSMRPTDPARAEAVGSSMVKIWENVAYKTHDKGGVRRYFDRPTTMCQRFEMHVTTLNKGLKSHEPHTHTAEEIVVVIDGKTEMQIGEQFYKGKSGDVYFLGSNVSHAIRNDGTSPCTYFAFQL